MKTKLPRGRPPHADLLTPAEWRTVYAVQHGMTNVEIARSVSDVVASEKWYRDVLGLPHLYTFGSLAFFDLGGTRLMLARKDDAAQESVLYLRVPDIGAAHAALTARGVGFTHAPHMIHRHADGTEEWLAFFEDPDGRPMAIMASVPGGG